MQMEIREIRGKNYNLCLLGLYDAYIYFKNVAVNLATNDKLPMELLITFLFALIRKKSGQNITMIGFPCIKDKINGVFYANKFNLENISIQDQEFDTVDWGPTNAGFNYSKIQVVRYPKRDAPNAIDFIKFLREKKFKKYKHDNSLYLLINIESRFAFEYAEISRLLQNEPIPFASIVAIGHLNPPQSKKFVGIKLFKILEGPIEIDFDKPPPG